MSVVIPIVKDGEAPGEEKRQIYGIGLLSQGKVASTGRPT
jgi:hypothetical protein